MDSEEHRYPSCRSAPTQQAEIPLPVSPCQGSMKTGGVLAIVPARGGSKGLSRKNLRLLGGHPLTGWAVQAGVQAAAVERTICTTDDPEIAAVAKAYGAEVPFLRPPELAQDTTLDLPVFIHTLDWLADRENWQPEFVIHLRPTSPFRGHDYVDHAVRLLRGDPQCTSVRSVCRPAATPFKMWRLSKGGRQAPYMLPLLDIPGNPEPFNSPRQALPAVYWHNGIVDSMRVSTDLKISRAGDRRPICFHYSTFLAIRNRSIHLARRCRPCIGIMELSTQCEFRRYMPVP